MIQGFTASLRLTRLRACALALLAGTACNTETVAPDGAAPGTAAASGSPASSDSASMDSVSLAAPALAYAGTSGVPYGPFRLWNSNTTVYWGPSPHTGSANFTGAGGIVTQINAARNMRQTLMLMMTSEPRSYYMTNGKFDLSKWKRAMDPYRTTAIKNAVAAGLADGTVLGNSVIDEPMNKAWGGNINKSVLDQMCTYVKGIFPTLPQGAVTVHWWRMTERYHVCDFIIDQFDWWQPPNGPGTGSSGNVYAWRDAGLARAKLEGIKIAFSMNILDGGIPVPGCPLTTTGGYGTYGTHCRMTASQVKEYGQTLGVSGCAMFMWRYDAAFYSKSANVDAIRAVAAKTAATPRRSCRKV